MIFIQVDFRGPGDIIALLFCASYILILEFLKGIVRGVEEEKNVDLLGVL